MARRCLSRLFHRQGFSSLEMAQRYLVAGLGVYEATVILTGRGPTISHCSWQLRDRWWGRPLLFMVWGWLTYHLYSEGPTGVVFLAAARKAASASGPDLRTLV